jgi:inorganic pyrophosphatase
MRKTLSVLLCSLATICALTASAAGYVHPFHAAQPPEAPNEVLLVVEIPAGSFTKYEIGPDGLLHVDRFIAMPVTYPANYGSVPRTRGGDGDPLDALIITRSPLLPGSLIRFRPIGVLRMLDRGEADEKVIGVPVDKVDASYAAVRELKDLPQQDLQRLEAFFRVYKQLPPGSDTIELQGWGDAAQARRLIAQGLRDFQEKQ